MSKQNQSTAHVKAGSVITKAIVVVRCNDCGIDAQDVVRVIDCYAYFEGNCANCGQFLQKAQEVPNADRDFQRHAAAICEAVPEHMEPPIVDGKYVVEGGE